MGAAWTVTGTAQRETMTVGGRFVKGFDVHFVVHATNEEADVFVPESDFLAERSANYIQPLADAMASTVGMTNAG